MRIRAVRRNACDLRGPEESKVELGPTEKAGNDEKKNQKKCVFHAKAVPPGLMPDTDRYEEV